MSKLTAILDHVARYRPPKPLLPKLKELRCHHTFEASSWPLANLCIFMHEGLQQLSISISSSKVVHSSFFNALPFQTPNLTYFEFRYSKSGRGYEDALLSCIRGLPKLETVILPAFPVPMSSVIRDDELKDLNHLEVNCFGDDGKLVHPAMTQHLQLAHFVPWSILDLSLTVRYELAATSLQVQGDALRLRSIIICSPIVESPHHVKQLASTIASTCRGIEKVHLTFNPKSDSIPKVDVNFPSESFVSLTDLDPLFQCDRMTDFRVIHLYSLKDVSASDGMLESFPNLRSLVLNPSGSMSTHRLCFSFNFFLKAAYAWPNIEYLGVLCSTRFIPSDQEIRRYSLRNLRTLDVGKTSVDKYEIQIAFLLSEILAPGCRIIWDTPNNKKPTSLNGWYHVEKLLPHLIERAKLMRTTIYKMEVKLKASMLSRSLLEQKVLTLTNELAEERELEWNVEPLL
ncbi:hypothetical protein K435DRAFT_839982 [Dendrothele bispora CBS 962.96]|uniref:F-box domain-containing protein n=1 Tax=Dendrothele bispora (strain CBS 962.96) TaxID=1314807 RepID=A0A4S8LWU2_DENBC|nr:hypothetical protein K435DRAFT_839982 [Dendrothele bispora CBS 962.96]